MCMWHVNTLVLRILREHWSRSLMEESEANNDTTGQRKKGKCLLCLYECPHSKGEVWVSVNWFIDNCLMQHRLLDAMVEEASPNLLTRGIEKERLTVWCGCVSVRVCVCVHHRLNHTPCPVTKADDVFYFNWMSCVYVCVHVAVLVALFYTGHSF